MSKEMDLLLGFATKAYNKTEDEIKALILEGDDIKDNATQALIDLDALKVKKFKDENTKMFDNGAKKREKEIHQFWETKIKDKFPELDAQGEELIEALHTTFEAVKVPKQSKLTDDDVKKHPVFIDYEKKWKKEKEDAITAKEKEFVQFKTGIERNNKISIVKSKANELFNSFKPILPKDIAKAENQKKMFLREFDEYDYEVSDTDIVIMKEGKRLENENGYPVAFDKFVKSKAEMLFEFQAQDPKGGIGNNNGGKKEIKKSGGVNMNPKSESEFSESILALGNDNAKIKELSDNYKLFKSQK